MADKFLIVAHGGKLGGNPGKLGFVSILKAPNWTKTRRLTTTLGASTAANSIVITMGWRCPGAHNPNVVGSGTIGKELTQPSAEQQGICLP
jgi:hypothetical protein